MSKSVWPEIKITGKINPPLKRRAIDVCPFKGAFYNSPAFQGWDGKTHVANIESESSMKSAIQKFRGFPIISRFRDSITRRYMKSWFNA